ncbi:MAG: NADH-quinone oxidoreductase subunit NuoF [bacterium]
MFTFTPDRKKRVAEILSAYPEKRATLLPLLWLVKEQEGVVTPEAIAHVAEIAGVAEAEAHEVKSFYAMFKGAGTDAEELPSNSLVFGRAVAPSYCRAACPRPLITRHFDVPRMAELAVARQHGAYVSLAKLSRLRPEDLIALVMDSGLRGRGGAGFPTGRKWHHLKRRPGKQVYLVVNADESEPGTFKDRAIIERDPHLLLEGIAIAAAAITADKVFVYFSGDDEIPMSIFAQALREAREGGLIKFDCTICRNAGAYICGEESALLNSIEGRRGEARAKPPFPTEAGLFGYPTAVQNVETLAVLPFILREGAVAFRGIGTADSPGTRLISLSGHVERPGVYEVEMGMPIAEFITECAGGIAGGGRLKALFPGGVSVPVLTAPEALASRIDFESIEDAGSHLGTGGMIAIDDSTCMVSVLMDIARFFAQESCGECTPCREGCGWIHKIARRIERGEGSREDINVMIDAADGMSGRTICALADGLAAAVLSIATKFRKEFEEHVRSGRCPSAPSPL